MRKLKLNSTKHQRRIQRFFCKASKQGYMSFSHVTDYRDKRKIKYSISNLLKALLYGMVTNQRGLRDVEELTEYLNELGIINSGGRISDTTLYTTAEKLNFKELKLSLVNQIKKFNRDKVLEPEEGLTINVITIDGKCIGSPNQSISKYCQSWKQKVYTWGRPGYVEYHRVCVLRAVLSSSRIKPVLYEIPISSKGHEKSECIPFLKELIKSYNKTGLVEVLDFDAGFCSKKIADYVINENKHYIMGLKKNQKYMYIEAEKLLSQEWASKNIEAYTGWEKRAGKKERRELYRVFCEGKTPFWSHVKQVWLLKKIIVEKEGKEKVEKRYFITSLPPESVKGEEIIRIIRNHWSIENDCFNSLDMQWKEDKMPWVRKGTGLFLLSLLRCMAYNIVQYLRRRHLRNKRKKTNSYISWKKMFRYIIESIRYIEPEEPLVLG